MSIAEATASTVSSDRSQMQAERFLRIASYTVATHGMGAVHILGDGDMVSDRYLRKP